VLRPVPGLRSVQIVQIEDSFLPDGIDDFAFKRFAGKCEYLQNSAAASRVGRAALGILRRAVNERHAEERRTRARVPPDSTEIESLEFLAFILPRVRPRSFDLFRREAPHCPPIILYTDAMYRPGHSAIGAVIFDRLDPVHPWRDTSGSLPESILRLWARREYIIGHAETLAPLVAILSRPEQFRGRDVILFIDNTQALYGLGKGDCRNPDCARMIHLFHVVCEALQINVWFEYVTSGANIADLPSRGEFTLLRAMGSAPFSPTWPDLQGSLRSIFERYWVSLSGSLSRAVSRHMVEIDDEIDRLRGGPERRKRLRRS
jgi:hypothetical protein